uniref:NBAS subunit of NRZ tethering complex n=1 Tax=Myxine glutinosa TaxID=7769 RepID=UPI00358F6BA3
MAADMETVLYELLVRAEWPCEHEAQPRTSNEFVMTTFVKKLCSSLSGPLWFILHNAGYRHIPSCSSLPAGLMQLASLQMNWKLMMSSNLKLLAVVQDQHIEIRSSKDDFGSVVGRCAVPRDAFPQWRHVCWNFDGTLLAHSDSSGHIFIFDPIGNLLFNIVPAAGCIGDLSQAVACMVFLKCDDNTRWSAQLLVITIHGLLTSYLIGLNTSQGYKETHRFSFRHHYPRGINTAIYNPAHRVLLVAGSNSGDSPTSTTEACGLTLWRVLSGPPHYKLVESDYVDVGKEEEEALLPTSYTSGMSQLKVGLWRWLGAILPASGTATHDAILRLSLSPSGTSLAALHESGKLSLWNVPSMTLRHTWHQEQQPDFDVMNPVWRNAVNRRTKIPGLASVPLLLDVKWWAEDALILVRCSGALTISSCVDLQNLLGRSCEWFEPSPAISAAFDGGFLTLECESKHSYLKRPRSDEHRLEGQQKDGGGKKEEEEEKSGEGEEEETSVMSRCGRLVRYSLYYVTESERFAPPRKRPRTMVHTYRLIKLKSTTPQELYQRKIDSEEYGEALQLAQVYGLDTDLVYQQQWRRKPVSIISIQDYLTKIRKPEWVLHECLERVPENVDAAKELLLYGLKGTGLDALLTLADGERHDRFVMPGDLDLPEISYEDPEEEPEIEEELLCRRQQEREKRLLTLVNFSNLTLGQRDLCRCRLRLLNFLDRLATYEEILGGPQAAERLYNAEFFKTFRSQNLLVSARNYTRHIYTC